MKILQWILLASSVVLGVVLGLVQPAHAQDYPTKAVHVLVGYAPGGGADILTRAFAGELQKALGQPFVVENRPGANGILAAAQLAKSAPDGYTLGVAVPSNVTNMLLYKSGDERYDFVKDFAPIAPMATTPLILVVHPSLPVNNVKELIALAKAKPGEINYAGAGSASSAQLFMELMNYKAGIKMTHVPYKGGSPGLMATLSGEVSATWVSTAVGLSHIKAGKLKALAVSTEKRIPALPDVPTLSEAGVPGYIADVWYGLQAPAGTPKAIIQKLNSEMTRIAKTPQMQERIEKLGAIPLYATPEQFAATIAAEGSLWSELFKNVQIKTD